MINLSNSTYAKGVAAGTIIENKVIVSYKIKGVDQIPLESSPNGNSIAGIGKGQSTSFKVDRKIDLSLTGNTNAHTKSGEKQVAVTFTLTNEGNDSQEFSLIADSSLKYDDFDINNCITTVTAISGTALTGVTTPTTEDIKLKADQQATISVKCDVPTTNAGTSINIGKTALLSLYATAEKNIDGSLVQESKTADISQGIETVFVDGSGSDDSNRDASYSARRNYIISSVNPIKPVAVNDSSIDNLVGKPVTLNPIKNDDPNKVTTLNPTTLVLLGHNVSQNGKKLIISGEGIWSVNPEMGFITFTPDAEFTGNPTPVRYTVKNNKEYTSNPATITVIYSPVVTNAKLNINKSIVKTISPNGDNKAVKGAIVTYRINITTSGKGLINDTIITDPTPTGMSYKAQSIYLNNQMLTDTTDSDNADFGISHANTATIKLGDINAGESHQILLSYIIN